MRSTGWFKGVPAKTNSSSLSPSHSRNAAYLFSATASLNFLSAWKERRREINENPEEDQFEIKI